MISSGARVGLSLSAVDVAHDPLTALPLDLSLIGPVLCFRELVSAVVEVALLLHRKG
jgi:hypothetical protein